MKFSLLLLLVLSTMALLPPRSALGETCLRQEPENALLSGRLAVKVFPGPPNYESIPSGDRPEKCWILLLDRPICPLEESEFHPTEQGIGRIQLLFTKGPPPDLPRLIRKRVVAKGSLFPAHTGHHHAEILMDVAEILLK